MSQKILSSLFHAALVRHGSVPLTLTDPNELGRLEVEGRVQEDVKDTMHDLEQILQHAQRGINITPIENHNVE